MENNFTQPLEPGLLLDPQKYSIVLNSSVLEPAGLLPDGPRQLTDYLLKDLNHSLLHYCVRLQHPSCDFTPPEKAELLFHLSHLNQVVAKQLRLRQSHQSGDRSREPS